MNRRKWLILSVLFFCAVVLFLRWNKNELMLWNTNHFFVTADQPLSREKVKIEYLLLFSESREAYGLSADKKKVTIYDGKQVNELVNEYGENDFIVTYDDIYQFSFRQFKTNRRHQHNYHFYFYELQDTIFVKVDIKGIDGEEFVMKMRRIIN